MISGAHVIVYSKDAEADRAFLRDVLRFTHVDVGGGWLIFGLPPAEVAVHPSDGDSNGTHELYLMCDDVEQFRAEMERQGVTTGPTQDMGWGVLTDVVLPGGGKLGVYQPRHDRPEPMGGGPSGTKAGKSSETTATGRPGAKRPAAKKRTANKPSANKRTANKQIATKRAAKKPTRKPR